MNSYKSPEEFFEKNLEDELLKARNRMHKTRVLNYGFQITIIILSAVSTIVLGFNYSNDDKSSLITSKNIALILGAVITLLSSIRAFWNLDTYWIRRKLYYYQLKEIRDEFYFYRGSDTKLSVDDLFRKLQAVKKFNSSYWEEVYQQSHVQQAAKRKDVNIIEN
jgi:hypothetical protein